LGQQLGMAIAALTAIAVGLAGCGGGHQAAAAPSSVQAAPTQVSAQDPNNPLIGQWRFVGYGNGPSDSPSGCSTEMTFTADNWMQVQGGVQGTPTTNTAVTYIPGPKTVYVLGADGGHITYILVDASHIALESAWPCTYARVG
jgi:hypothetical protein